MLKKILLTLLIVIVLGGIWLFAIEIPKAQRAIELSIYMGGGFLKTLCPENDDKCSEAFDEYYHPCLATIDSTVSVYKPIEMRDKLMNIYEETYSCVGKRSGIELPNFWAQMMEKRKKEHKS